MTNSLSGVSPARVSHVLDPPDYSPCPSSTQWLSVAQSCLTLRPHGLQHGRLPCPSPSPGACLNSCPLSRWCHPSILSSGIPFSSCLHSFQASGSFTMSWVFYNELALHIMWPKYWSFSFNTYHSNEFAGLIFFRIDQLDVQGMLKLLLQHHNSKASVL